MKHVDDLVVKAATLARSSPHAWEPFAAALEVYSTNQAALCVSAPLTELQRMQGRAQEARYLTNLLQDAMKTADRVQQKQAVRQQRV